MNGRVYDPVLGRFLSADPFVDDAADSQSYNRYSYVSNNPLNHTDPSGYFKLKDALKIVAIVVVTVVSAGWAAAAWGPAFVSAFGVSSAVGAGMAGGLAGGFASGFAGSLLNGGSIGDAFKADVIGGTVGMVTGGILGKIGTMESLNSFERGLAHGAVHGGAAEAQGGEFRHGYYSGFLNGSLDGRIETTFQNSETIQCAAAAVVGGTGSVIGGGKFANGAVSGAFSYMFNNQGRQVMKGLLKARTGLRLFGNIPFIGEIADLASAGISLAAGDYVGAAIDLGSAIPGIGNGVRAGGLAVDAVKAIRQIDNAHDAVRFHHAWPKYLGGAQQQILEPLPKWMYDAYHSGLDKILPRQRGADFYQKMSPAARQQLNARLGAYTKAFDAQHNTQLFDAMVREGFPGR
ncbi:MAG: hypothetical protein KBA71_02080 [Opitutaceae bacterium]|nr:hypothetical protein [Opitutaceae bacterium]